MNIQTIRNNIRKHFEDKHNEYLAKQRNRSNRRYGKYYHSKQWQQLRNQYYAEHPICECHEKLGIIVPGEEIHHLKKWASAPTEEAKWSLLLNPKNLVTLCKPCHILAHKIMNKNHIDYIPLDKLVEYQKSTLNTFE